MTPKPPPLVVAPFVDSWRTITATCRGISISQRGGWGAVLEGGERTALYSGVEPTRCLQARIELIAILKAFQKINGRANVLLRTESQAAINSLGLAVAYLSGTSRRSPANADLFPGLYNAMVRLRVRPELIQAPEFDERNIKADQAAREKIARYKAELAREAVAQ